jgi:hypothetical protein
MLIEELFARGIMTMGPSRNDPARRVGVFAPGVLASAMAARTAEIERLRWIAGVWRFENPVPATRSNPAYADVGTQKFAVSESDGWVYSIAPDGGRHPTLTVDPFSGRWIYVLLRGSFGVLRSREGWRGNQIAFSGTMTMVGVECEWRMTWTRTGDNRFQFVNEEKNLDGSWTYIDEWRFERV